MPPADRARRHPYKLKAHRSTVKPLYRQANFNKLADDLLVEDAVRIWVRGGDSQRPVNRTDDPDRWLSAVESNMPITIQMGGGAEGPWPTSSSSQPSIMANMLDALDPHRGHRVLEIGTGTGWNAALLCHRVGPDGRVLTIEVDPSIAETATRNLRWAGYPAVVVTGDGVLGYPDGAPFDRVVSTAAIRDVVPPAWVQQLRPDGRLVTPWGTDWWNGFLLTLAMTGEGRATGRFSGNLSFMRVRAQHSSLYGFEPDETEIGQATATTTECRGSDLAAMLDPDQALFAIGARVPDCYRYLEWDHFGPRHHLLDLDDGRTRSFARLEWDVSSTAPFTVRQLGARRLWDEVEKAYVWWRDQGRPGMDRFGLEINAGHQWLWLDSPDHPVRDLTERP